MTEIKKDEVETSVRELLSISATERIKEDKKTRARKSDLMNVAELCKYLGLNRDTIYRELKSGALPGFRVGLKIWRFRKTDINEWIDGRTKETRRGLNG